MFFFGGGFSEARLKDHLCSALPTKVMRHATLAHYHLKSPKTRSPGQTLVCNSATLTKGGFHPSTPPPPNLTAVEGWHTVTGARIPLVVFTLHFTFHLYPNDLLSSPAILLQQQPASHFYAHSHLLC